MSPTAVDGRPGSTVLTFLMAQKQKSGDQLKAIRPRAA
jgi:hypothetical protein